MKTRNKALVLTLCAVLLVVATVMGTLAYLTGNDKVTNTFTIGNITMTLDEAKVGDDGKAITGDGALRVKENPYHLVPGNAYDKDPTVHIAPNSDDCWVFVKVENGIAALEAQKSTTYTPINDQIVPNNWTKLEGVAGADNVYYKEYEKTAQATDYIVFKGFTIADDANTKDAWKNYSPDAKPQVVVTAYAIQKDGFATAADAWAQVSTANP